MIAKLLFALLSLRSVHAAKKDCTKHLTGDRVRTELSFDLAGEVSLKFRSNQTFAWTEDDRAQLAAHLPSVDRGVNPSFRPHVISHVLSADQRIKRRGRHVTVDASWTDRLPADFPHLAYGVARRAWLKQNLFPVHAACVGDPERGYVLLVGDSGAGKTSVALDAVTRGLKLFSGDKTLLRLTPRGTFEAIAGTRVITVRREDVPRWTNLPKVDAAEIGNRLTFRLSPQAYAPTRAVPIKAILQVRLNDGRETVQPLSTESAAHTLYPLFLDKQREDVWIGGDRAVFDGRLSLKTRRRLHQRLIRGLANTKVTRVVGSVPVVRRTIAQNLSLPAPARGPKKIVLGICGIGNGHLNRQLPVLEHLLNHGDQVMVFAYGASLARLRETHADRPGLTVIEVANPYFVGTPHGLDFGATAAAEVNQVDFTQINAIAIDRALRSFGTPDLVISDYEMVSAQLAYAKSVPLLTLDQQSKFLSGDLPPALRDTSARDEVERLNMFFPRAAERLVASFFKLPVGPTNIRVLPPIIRDEIQDRRGMPLTPRPSVYVYISAQDTTTHGPANAILPLIDDLPARADFHVYLPGHLSLPHDRKNVFFRHFGTPGFDDRLAEAHGVITTAGHTLISEAMFLEKPVLAMPLRLFEQQLNAHVIESNGFGMNVERPTLDDIESFLDHLTSYAANIRRDTEVLFHEAGNERVIEHVEAALAK